MNTTKYFALFAEDAKTIKDYCTNGEDRLAIFDAMLSYLTGGNQPAMQGIAAFAWTTIFQKQQRGEQIRSTKAQAGAKGGHAGAGVSRNIGNHHASNPAIVDGDESKANQKQINSKSIAENSTSIANQKESKAYSTLQDSTKQNNTNTLPTPPSIPQGGSDSDAVGSFDLTDSFATFWTAYPRKISKANAEKAYTKALKGVKDPAALADKILAALAAHKRTDQWIRDNGQYIPHAATWLHQRRWEDELPLAAQTTTVAHSAQTATATPSPTSTATPSPVPSIDLVTASGQQLEDYLRGRLDAAKCIPGQIRNATSDLIYRYTTYRDAYARQGWCDDYGHRILHPDRWLEAWLGQEVPRAVAKAGEDAWNDRILSEPSYDDEL